MKTSINQEKEEASKMSTESSEPVRAEMETNVQTLTESISNMKTETPKTPATTSTLTSQTEISRDHPEDEKSMPEQIRQEQILQVQESNTHKSDSKSSFPKGRCS